MEKSFDFGALLQKHEKQHKGKPVQFSSVANGVKRRLDSNIKRRKSSRLTVFDKTRNMQLFADSPKPKSDNQQKIEHRRMQLEKWKEEKEKKKMEAASQKKKPFLVGVAHAPARFVPPPPPKVMPSTSGRVTRSLAARNKANKQAATSNTANKSKNNSFAPPNATFRPPEIKNLDNVPTLSLPKRQGRHGKSSVVKFEPVMPNKESKTTIKKGNVKPKVDATNTKKIKQIGSSNSGSSVESEVETKKPLRKSKEPIVNTKTVKNKQPLLNSTNSTESESSQEEIKVKTPRKSKDTNKTPEKRNSKKSVISVESSGSESFESPVNKKAPLRKSVGKKDQGKVIQSSNSDSSLGSPVEIKKTPKKSIENSTPSKRTPLRPIPKSESSSEERLRSPKSPVDVPMTPEQIIAEAKKISPCVTLSRGKDNARREMKQKIAEGLLDDDLNDMDSIDHFKKQLNSEIKRLSEMCETWEKISEQITLPEVVQEAVLGAVGQARLLMSQKLQQFAGLIARCEVPDSSQPLVTAADLHGFWDMVFMQVVNVDMRFKKLEEMQARGWSVEEQVVERRRKVVKPKPNKPAATSRLRDMIAAARKAKKEQEPKAEEPTADSKTFDAGFFSVRSPVRSSVVTPSKPTLLKAVLSSEANKSASKNSASLAMLRASMFGKSMEQESNTVEENLIQFTPVNLHATPGRSILKSTTTQSKKSIKCVLFDSSDTDLLDQSIDKDISGIQKLEDTLSMGLETEKQKLVRQDAMGTISLEEKENKKELMRQDAVDRSPIMTRNRRKSLQTPNKEEFERNTKILQESDLNTPRRTRRTTRKKSLVCV